MPAIEVFTLGEVGVSTQQHFSNPAFAAQLHNLRRSTAVATLVRGPVPGAIHQPQHFAGFMSDNTKG